MNLAIIEITVSINKPKAVRLLVNCRLEKVVRSSAGYMWFSSTWRWIKLKAKKSEMGTLTGNLFRIRSAIEGFLTTSILMRRPAPLWPLDFRNGSNSSEQKRLSPHF